MREKAKTDSHNDPENNVTQLQKFHQPTAGTTIEKFRQFKDRAKIRIEQNNDVVLRNLRKRIEKQDDFEETEYKSDYRHKHYDQNSKRIEVQQEVLVRKYCDDTGKISHYQVLLPYQLRDEFLFALHGQKEFHPGITKMIQEARQKYYYPCLA